MNKLDWYFRQIVSQSEMDQVFDWAEEADQAITQGMLSDPTASENGGIISGGNVSEQTVPDLTVAVSAILAWDKDGRRIYDSTPSVNVDCSVDEYGTDTVVSSVGESRIISIFARFKTELQDPAVDGNGLTVYTRQVESMEFFVRMGSSAVSPTPPPLLSDALLLVDITRAQGQTTIQNTDMDSSRREDWVRFNGTTISSFVHGTPKEALRELFGYVDTGWSGGTPFSFTEDWYGSEGVGIAGGSAPTNVGEALNAIVEDLASVYAPQLLGTTELADWKMIVVDSVTGMYAGEQLTNSSGGTAIVGRAYFAYNSDVQVVIVHSFTGTWNFGDGIDIDTSYSAPPDTYYRGTVASYEDVLTGDSLYDILYNIALELYQRPDLNKQSIVLKDQALFSYQKGNYSRFDHCHMSGGGSIMFGALDILQRGYPIDNTDDMWGHAYATKIALQANNLVDVCAGWNFEDMTPCVYAVGDNYSGDVIICRANLRKSVIGALTDDYAVCTGDASDTPLTTLNSDAEAFAVCSNGDKIFLLAQASASGASANIHCYDAKSFGTGTLKWLWTWNPGAMANALGTRKADSRIRVVDDYVFVLFGAERCDSTAPGTPLGRCNVSNGAGGLTGIGDGWSLAGTATPFGGLYVSREYDVFYSCGSTGGGEVVAATPTLGATGLTQLGVGTQTRDVLIPGGRYAVGCSPGVVVNYWDWADDIQMYFASNNLQDSDYNEAPVLADFDGTMFWIKFCIDEGSVGAGENYAVYGVHAAELRRYIGGSGLVHVPAKVYQLNEPRSTAAPNPPGRICAWGHGIFNIPFEDYDNDLEFLPFSRLY